MINSYYEPYFIDIELMASVKDEINKQAFDLEFKQKLIELNRNAKLFPLPDMLNLLQDKQKLQTFSKKLIV